MKRILIHIPMATHGEYDIFSPYDSKALVQDVRQNLGGVAPNYGNRLWFQGIISEIQSDDNHLEYFRPDMTKEQINSDYDMIVAPMANVFLNHYSGLLNRLADRFEGIRIPVYVIACGIQADSFDDLEGLVNVLREPASRFISNVYKTGGEFALRGYFTKEFFTRLGFDSAVVTGCPSLFQRGRNLSISDEKVSKEAFHPLLNGNIADYPKLFEKYQNSEFFDQNIYFNELFVADSDIKDMIHRHGLLTTELLLSDRVKLIPSMNLWREYLRHEGFNFSFGSRIHGSIMPILSGVCTVLEHRDARTREMAEFFGIPTVTPGSNKDLYALYQETSYRSFNENFGKRFDAYEQFLKNCGIVEKINENNPFFQPLDTLPPITDTAGKRSALYQQLQKKKLYWKGYDALLNTKRKLRG